MWRFAGNNSLYAVYTGISQYPYPIQCTVFTPFPRKTTSMEASLRSHGIPIRTACYSSTIRTVSPLSSDLMSRSISASCLSSSSRRRFFISLSTARLKPW